MTKSDLDHILDNTRDLWAELRGERLFITGGTGFLGRWLLESFAYANRELSLKASVTVLSRDPDEFIRRAPHLGGDPAFSFRRGDVRDFAFPEAAHKFIIHGAAAVGAGQNAEALQALFDTIIRGTARTLDFAAKTGCGKFLFISSGAVYGKQPPDMPRMPEFYTGGPDTMRPNSAYEEGKRAAELLCAMHHERHPETGIKVARCFAAVGPHMPMNAHLAIGNFIRDAALGGTVRVNGDGTPLRSYIYAADLAVWLWTILFRARPCRPYNVGSPDPVSILETAKAVAGLSDPALPVAVAQTPGGGPPQRYVPDVSLAGAELGLTCKIGLADAVARTMAFHKESGYGN